jgi:hypothetical protein
VLISFDVLHHPWKGLSSQTLTSFGKMRCRSPQISIEIPSIKAQAKKMKSIKFLLFSLSFTLVANPSQAAELLTNAAHFADAPKWVTSTRVNRIASQVQNMLEWDIHRVEVVFYKDAASFEKAHGLGPLPVAVSIRSGNRILIGPKVTDENFDGIFGHELVHVISYQKYKDAIPAWLEEGLANHVSQGAKVNYKWLATQPLPHSVEDLKHPFAGATEQVRYGYVASQALIEMIAAKCDLRNLLRLSVGRKMESYLDTYCNIKDLNAAFAKWVQDHAKN